MAIVLYLLMAIVDFLWVYIGYLTKPSIRIEWVWRWRLLWVILGWSVGQWWWFSQALGLLFYPACLTGIQFRNDLAGPLWSRLGSLSFG